jgi:hypothetical protein
MATILDLLMALNDGNLPPLPDPAKPVGIPLAPTGNLGPLSNDTAAAFGAQNPEPVPPALTQPAQADPNFVNQYAGAAPTAPAPRSTLDRVFGAIGGFGAGLQGQGQQFLSQLQEPQREYQRQLERYEGRRAQGTELAERRAEREATQANRALEQQYDNEYKKWLSKNSDRSDEAKLRMQQSFQLERDAKAARLEEEREFRRERRQLERDARAIEERYFTASKNRALSRELGRHWAGLSDAPLSPAAAKLDARLANVQDVRMGRAGGGGGTGGGSSSAVENTLAEFETLKQMAIQAVKGKGGTPEDELEAVRRATAGVVRKMARQPRLFDVGTGRGGYLYAQPRASAGQQQPLPGAPGGPQGPFVPANMKAQPRSAPVSVSRSQAKAKDPLGIR